MWVVLEHLLLSGELDQVQQFEEVEVKEAQIITQQELLALNVLGKGLELGERLRAKLVLVCFSVAADRRYSSQV